MNIYLPDNSPLAPIAKYVSELELTNAHLRNALDTLADPRNVLTERVRTIGAFLQFLQIPYLLGGTFAKNQSLDCSSFTQLIYSHLGIALPRTSRAQATTGTEVPTGDLLPLDLIFFDTNRDGTVNHVAIYVGNGEILHTNNDRERIHTEQLSAKYEKWMTNIRRVI